MNVIGQVVDQNGDPLPNVHVYFVNPTNGEIIRGTTTGIAGQYDIEHAPFSTMVFRHIGYVELRVPSESVPEVYNVQLDSAAYGIPEFEVVGGYPNKKQLWPWLLLAAAAGVAAS